MLRIANGPIFSVVESGRGVGYAESIPSLMLERGKRLPFHSKLPNLASTTEYTISPRAATLSFCDTVTYDP
jgi:hypothetical protein